MTKNQVWVAMTMLFVWAMTLAVLILTRSPPRPTASETSGEMVDRWNRTPNYVPAPEIPSPTEEPAVPKYPRGRVGSKEGP